MRRSFIPLLVLMSFPTYCWPSGKKLEIIDAHIHTTFSGTLDELSNIPSTMDELYKEMKEANVVGAVALDAIDGTGYADLSSHHIIHCMGVPAKPDLDKLREGLSSRKYRCLKIYLGYEYQFADDENYRKVYPIAAEFGVPVVFHAGDPSISTAKLVYSYPLAIDTVAVDYRNVTFVIAHLGSPWVETAAEIAYKNPNVYVDVSALVIGDLKNREKGYVRTYVTDPIKWAYGYIENPKKIMYGSDWPLVRLKDYIDAVKNAIPKKHWKEVFHDNAVEVFKVK